jgi:hypothetical protein
MDFMKKVGAVINLDKMEVARELNWRVVLIM